MTALPVEPRPLSYSNIYAEDLRDLPVECWDDEKQRRFVILARRSILTDDTMCGFTARWVDEDRVQNIRLWARRFVKVIGVWDWGPDSHPELWQKVADPDGWADSDERKNRRFGVQR